MKKIIVLKFSNMYMDESNAKSYPNLINKFKFKPNFILAKIKLEPKPCDLANNDVYDLSNI